MGDDRDNSVLTLLDEDGKEHDFEVLDIVELEEGRYAILLPRDEEYANTNEAIIMKISVDENGEEVLFDIEDDEEWEKVADAYDELIEEDDDYDEEDDEDEE
ncbi:MAG: DUF1292 domain-containing protein [Clostridiales bacterium]|nr:DUF1292 domain-containing protein [Clostridiales bacterium]